MHMILLGLHLKPCDDLMAKSVLTDMHLAMMTPNGAPYALVRDAALAIDGQEIAWAADATRFAIEKSLAALDYNGWRERPKSLGTTQRRQLARRFDELVEEQTNQLRRFEVLWLARSETSELPKIRKRILRSIAGLRDAARRLRKNAPSRPARSTELSLLAVYDEIRHEMGMSPR